MPIRLNLLAEAQAAEELRRRDPVKRAIWVAVLLVAAILAWGSSLQLKAMLANSELSRVQGEMNSLTNEYHRVVESRKKSAEIKQKLSALRQLTANRFLNGTLLDALQHTTVDDVQLVRLKAEQSYVFTEGTKPRTNASRTLPETPPTITERILVTLDGSDSSPASDQYNKLKEAVAASSYFQKVLARTNGVSLRNLGSPQVSPATGKACVLFSLECRYPETTR